MPRILQPAIRGLRALRVVLPQLRQTLLDFPQIRVHQPSQLRGQPIALSLVGHDATASMTWLLLSLRGDVIPASP